MFTFSPCLQGGGAFHGRRHTLCAKRFGKAAKEDHKAVKQPAKDVKVLCTKLLGRGVVGQLHGRKLPCPAKGPKEAPYQSTPQNSQNEENKAFTIYMVYMDATNQAKTLPAGVLVGFGLGALARFPEACLV